PRRENHATENKKRAPKGAEYNTCPIERTIAALVIFGLPRSRITSLFLQKHEARCFHAAAGIYREAKMGETSDSSSLLFLSYLPRSSHQRLTSDLLRSLASRFTSAFYALRLSCVLCTIQFTFAPIHLRSITKQLSHSSSMSTALPHVIAFLSRGLLAKFSPGAVTSLQLILTASLRSAPSTATFILTSATGTLPAPLRAASTGSGIPWSAWFSILSGGAARVLLFYGPDYVKLRIGDGALVDLWRARVPAAAARAAKPLSMLKGVAHPLLQANTGARLRAALLSARVRHSRRLEAASVPEAMELSDSDDSDDSESDMDSYESRSTVESDSDVESPSSFYSYDGFDADSDSDSDCDEPISASDCDSDVATWSPSPAVKAQTYVYQGGVTRVTSGGVMLGSASASSKRW
ncbi:unnamed protein product, partial [Mycena citricolor]